MYSHIIKTFSILFCASLLYSSAAFAIPHFDATGQVTKTEGGSDFNAALYGNTAGTGTPNDTANWNWHNGGSSQAVNWELDYVASTGQMTWIWGVGGEGSQTLNQTVSQNVGLQVLSGQIGVVAQTTTVSSNNSIAITNLVLNTGTGPISGSNVTVTGANQLASFIFPNAITGNFTLTGTTVMNWTGGKPTNNQTFAVQDFNSVPVPEPTTLVLLAAGSTMLAYQKRRKAA